MFVYTIAQAVCMDYGRFTVSTAHLAPMEVDTSNYLQHTCQTIYIICKIIFMSRCYSSATSLMGQRKTPSDLIIFNSVKVEYSNS